jgi:dTDP-4-dehydrorhamnose reductase
MFLVVGANSEIGSATARLIRARDGKVMTTTRRRAEATASSLHLDFEHSVDGLAIPEEITAACIFVAVARLAACAADPEGSARVNVERTLALVDRLTAAGIYTLFLSTNQVFNGDQPHMPAEAPTSPVSEYGRQKAETERALRARVAGGAPIGMLRLAKVVSPGMALVDTWRRELIAGRSIRAFSDMTMAPVPVDIVATSIARLMEDRLPIVAQLTGPRDVTYADIGHFVAESVGAYPELVDPVSALENGLPPGSTPRNTTLDSSYLIERYGLTVPDAFEVIGSLSSAPIGPNAQPAMAADTPSSVGSAGQRKPG